MELTDRTVALRSLSYMPRITVVFSVVIAAFTLLVTDYVNAGDLYRSAVKFQTEKIHDCPDRWVPSSAPGGCSPGFFTSNLAEIRATKGCPSGWVSSSAPGGCSPGFFTLELAGIRATKGCPSGWVSSSAPGGCSPGFFTLRMNGTRDSIRSCPDGWVRSSAPGGCSPEYLKLQTAGLHAIDSCPDGWVRSSAPGGCSPGSFTLETDFDGVDYARFHCAFGDACDVMIDAILALGGSCETDGPDSTCDLPPLHEE